VNRGARLSAAGRVIVVSRIRCGCSCGPEDGDALLSRRARPRASLIRTGETYLMLKVGEYWLEVMLKSDWCLDVCADFDFDLDLRVLAIESNLWLAEGSYSGAVLGMVLSSRGVGGSALERDKGAKMVTRLPVARIAEGMRGTEGWWWGV